MLPASRRFRRECVGRGRNIKPCRCASRPSFLGSMAQKTWGFDSFGDIPSPQGPTRHDGGSSPLGERVSTAGASRTRHCHCTCGRSPSLGLGDHPVQLAWRAPFEGRFSVSRGSTVRGVSIRTNSSRMHADRLDGLKWYQPPKSCIFWLTEMLARTHPGVSTASVPPQKQRQQRGCFTGPVGNAAFCCVGTGPAPPGGARLWVACVRDAQHNRGA